MSQKPSRPSQPAGLYVFQGDDALAIQDAFAQVVEQFADDGWLEINTTMLDGVVVSITDVANAVNMLPLGGGRRLTLLRDVLSFANSKEKQEFMRKLLSDYADSTILILIVYDSKKYQYGKVDWEKVKRTHWLKKAVNASKKNFLWLEFPLPNSREMPGWIMQEAEKQGGKFEGAAAAELARLVETNTLQARHEIAKAISYVGEGKPISREDVRLLCPPSTEEKIFSLVDAVGKRDARSALALLQRLQIALPIQYIFSMVVRQIRLLIVAKEILECKGTAGDLQSAAGVPSFVAKKLFAQSSHFKMQELEIIYRQLDRMDEATKMGRGSLERMLETMIADLGEYSPASKNK